MNKIKIIGIIPTRLSSSRFPNKPLKQIGGKPVIQWCYDHTAKSQFLDETRIVCPAEDFDHIFNATSCHPDLVVSPPGKYRNGTERSFAAVDFCGLEGDDIVVDIQGDNAFFDPRIIDEGIFYLLTSDYVDCCTPIGPLFPGDLENSSVVKVGTQEKTTHGDLAESFLSNPNIIATNFSRLVCGYYQHVGIYFWRWRGLKKYMQYTQTQNEIDRSLEQMRWIDSGEKMGVFFTDRVCDSVNTEEDYEKIKEFYDNGVYGLLGLGR